MFTNNNDYAYISVFIGFLKEIISVIQRLFTGRDVTTGDKFDDDDDDDEDKE